jgi:hypothetical protein
VLACELRARLDGVRADYAKLVAMVERLEGYLDAA